MSPLSDAAADRLALIRARLARGWTQGGLAKKLGVTRETVNRWENGGEVKLSEFRLWASVLGYGVRVIERAQGES